MAIIIKMAVAEVANSRFPVDIFRNSATGRDSVFILVAPATIIAAPNSLISRDHVITNGACHESILCHRERYTSTCREF